MPITQTNAVLLACSLFAMAAQAQQTSAPTPADTAAAARTGVEQDQLIQQQREAQQREAAVNAPSVRSTRDDAPAWPALPNETPCFQIDTFVFEIPTISQATLGATAAQTQSLGRFTFAQDWVEHYAGACIGKRGLDALVKGLQKVVLSRGYLTTRVLLPEQDLSSGTLRLALIPGVIRQVRFADPTLRGTWKSAFPTRDGALLDLRDLEQGLEQMKRVSNQDVSMQIVPANLPGQSDVVLDVTRTKPWTVVASVDNAGSRATGQLQGSLSAGLYNPLGLNDIFNVGVTQDLLFKEHDLGSRGWHASYAIPWGYWSATLAAYTSRYYQRIAGVNETFIASGNSKTLDATLSRVLSRSQNHVFGTQLRLSRRFGQSFIEDIEITQQRRNNTLVEWGLTDRHYFGAAQLDAALAYRQGIGGLGAQDVLLQANNQVNLSHSTDTESSHSESESKSGSIGVSYGTSGWGVSASLSKSNGDANSDSKFQNNTHINASRTAVIASGGDTNIVGANVNADKVIARVGGDLNIASVQDTSESSAHQQSMGGGLSVSMGGASGSLSFSRGNASGNYAGVEEQSGIQAGGGGFDIGVMGNTDLKGAYIASTADPSKNQLTTATLTFSDIENHSEYSANSFGVGGGATVGNGGANERTTGNSSGKNTGGISPMLPQMESGSERATTRTGVSEGTITLTNEANQTQDLASLNRDTADLNGTVTRTPDLQDLLNDQSRLMQAATAAGEAVARDIGRYADKKKDEALKLAEKTDDPTLKAQYLQEAKDWSEGGDYRATMHAAGGAIVAGLGGGNALGGAFGAGIRKWHRCH